MSVTMIFCCCLVELLGSPVYKERATAQHFLAKSGEYALWPLSQGEKSDNPERAIRCQGLLDNWYRENAERIAESMLPSGWTYYPWIDSLLYCEPPGENSEAYSELRLGYIELGEYTLTQRGGDPHANYARFSEATRFWLIDMVRMRKVAEARELVALLAEGHRNWCRLRGLTVPP